MNYVAKIVVFSLCSLVSTGAFAQQSQKVGTSSKIVNNVKAKNNGATRTLNVTDPVYAAETITATPQSHGEIRLNDNSRIIVGPGSVVSLDDFLVSNNKINNGTMHIAKGAFRFISGKSRKGTFKVTTPLSTIGIRGTIFDVYVKNNGVTDVILFSGKVEVCSSGGQCLVMTQTCDIVRVESRNSITSRNFLRSGIRRVENQEYNLISNQGRFPAGWQSPTGACDHRALLENPQGNGDTEGLNVDNSGNPDESEYSGSKDPK